VRWATDYTIMVVTDRIPAGVGALLERGDLRTVFQPIVDLDCDAVIIGYEALARGPQGDPLEMPLDLFAAAESEGLVAELDRACRNQAISAASAAGLENQRLLFVNIEPAWLEDGPVLDELSEKSLGDISLVVELTERALAARPSEILEAVRWLRRRGCRIALDDVGVDRRSLALMPFLAPDVIKLDRSIIQSQVLGSDAARVVNAIGAEAERSGAVILAEGIETEADVTRARAMGARLGQGWLFGRPAPLARQEPAVAGAASVGRRPPVSDIESTPFELIADSRRTRRGDKRLLLSLSRQLEREALSLQREAVVLATFQRAEFFSDATRRRYEELAAQVAFVGALGSGLSQRPADRVRGASIDNDESLAREWDVIVVAPHFAGAFVARDLGDEGDDMERRFEFFLTYDRSLVTSAAQALLRRIIRDR
jgi:EAL domain-containing protein (putative c-di-GMP-specific phosphodiesterase class I)